jgi:hypothetical protein
MSYATLFVTAFQLGAVLNDADSPQVMMELKVVQVAKGTDMKLTLQNIELVTELTSTKEAGREEGFRVAVVPLLSRALAARITTDLEGTGYQVLSAPKLIAVSGQSAAIAIGEAVPYMTQRSDGSLVVEKSDDLTEGLSVELIGRVVAEDRVDVEVVKLKLSRVVERREIAGVPFDVGAPVIRTIETSARMTLSRSDGAAIRLPALDGDDTEILVFVWAHKLKPTKAQNP